MLLTTCKKNYATATMLGKNHKIFISILIIVLGLTAITCSKGYKTFTFTHSNKPSPGYQVIYTTNFSFEYPGNYRKVATDVEEYLPNPIEIRFASGGMFSLSDSDVVFGVNVKLPTVERRNAKTAANLRLSSIEDTGVLHERTVITVDSLPAEIIVYTSPDTSYDRHDGYEVYFDFDNRIWEIFMYSNNSSAEQAKTDFDHIIKSFEILN